MYSLKRVDKERKKERAKEEKKESKKKKGESKEKGYFSFLYNQLIHGKACFFKKKARWTAVGWYTLTQFFDGFDTCFIRIFRFLCERASDLVSALLLGLLLLLLPHPPPPPQRTILPVGSQPQ